MSDETAAANAGQANTQQPQQQFEIQKIYLKDVSVETPNSPLIFTEQWKPEVNLQLNHTANGIAEQVHEVVLTLTVTAKQADKTAYLVEIKQAGIFGLRGFSGDQLGAMLGAYCPNMLFPYAREAISSLIQKSGFPPLLLNPVNFDALYMQQLARQKAAAQDQQQAPSNGAA